MNYSKTVKTLHVAILIIVSAVLASCNNAKPLTAPETGPVARASAGHAIMGSYEVRIDLNSLEVSAVPVRSADAHFDVTTFLKPPVCTDCFRIRVVDFDLVKLEVTAEVTVKNFTKVLTGYDVRGIVYPLGDYILKNAYAYTLLFAPPGVLEPSGFKAFDTIDPDRALGPQESATETFVVGFPSGATFVDLVYVVEASYPGHCDEACDISDFEQSLLDMSAGSEAQVTVYVSDWQNDTSRVLIDTDILGGSDVELSHMSGNLWSGTISNYYGAPPGDYPCLITAKDRTSLDNLYQKVNVKVVNFGDTEPPTWDSDIGITGAEGGMTGILVKFGSASDPSIPVTYNIYWAEGGTLDFDIANKITDVTGSPYILSVPAGLYTLAVRAQDTFLNETTNTNMMSATVGEHPNIYWTLGPSMTTPRAYSGGFLANGYFWVLGGYAAGVSLSAVERYSIANQQWDSPWDLPEPRDSFGCGTAGGAAYIFGGRFAETVSTDTCEIIDLTTGGALPGPPALPFPRMNPGCAILDGTFYITGGRAFTGSQWEYYRETLAFTPPGPDFEPETDMEIDTSMMGFAAGDTYMMTCGGSPERTDVQHHPPNAKSWQFRAPLEPGRETNCAVWVDGWLYSLGGMHIEHAFPEVQVLNVADDQWFTINPLLQPRFGAVAATDGSYIYIAGGAFAAGPAWIPIGSLEIGQIF